MRIKFIFILLLFSCTCFSQVLNLPPRPVGALNGSQFVALVTSYSLTNRENEIFNQVTQGNVPDFQRNLIPVTSTKTINSTSYTYTYYVIPDYLAIGCDTNYFLCPMTPLLAQRIADFTNCTMPTRQMVNDIWTTATVHLAPSTIPPSGQMVTIPVMSQHNTTVWGQRGAVLGIHPLGELVGGDKKDVVISNIIYGYPSPGRVVIYGWHYLSGTPIQPMYNGHEETYADYSHGIRLVQMNMILNGIDTTVNSILQSSLLNSLLSDEGSIAVPRYPVSLPTVATPTSFCVVNESPTSLRIIASPQTYVTHYFVQLSSDGLNFNTTLKLSVDTLLLTNLNTDSLYFIRIAAICNFDTSAYSEVLAAVPASCISKVMIVNGFDRPSTGNTFNFIRQHAKAIFNDGYAVASATNEAVIDSLCVLDNYKIVDYILGNESTANETFNNTEQTLVSDYLKQGGDLFVSGSEIAWDLDHLGSTADKFFYHNYLKASYVYDAPNNQTGIYYLCQPTDTSLFAGCGIMNFDNGTHGTFNVNYPDVISAHDSAKTCLKYTGLTANYAGVSFEGIFPGGTKAGKLINLGIPFETFYPDTARQHLMNKILEFFDVPAITPLPIVTDTITYCQFILADTLMANGAGLLWYSFPSGGTGSTIAPVPSAINPGNTAYYVSQTIDGCESERAMIIVKVISAPATPMIVQSNDTLFSSSLNGNQWYINGVALPGDTGNYYVPLIAGNYFVIVEGNDCYSDSSNVIQYVPASINVASADQASFCVYPVPVDDLLTIKANNFTDGNFEIELYSLQGQVLLKREFVHSVSIDMKDFPKGIYMLVITGNKSLKTVKIVKN